MGICDVGVNLGGRNIGMAKKRLDGTKIGAVHKKVSSKTMAESMWRNVFCYAG